MNQNHLPKSRFAPTDALATALADLARTRVAMLIELQPPAQQRELLVDDESTIGRVAPE